MANVRIAREFVFVRISSSSVDSERTPSGLSMVHQNTAVSVGLFSWIHSILMLSLAAAACPFVWNSTHRLPVGLRVEGSGNFVFEADAMRVFYNISARKILQTRSQVHPTHPTSAERDIVVRHYWSTSPAH